MEIVIRARHIGVSEDCDSLNGPRGGVDKVCQIAAELRGTRPVIILELGDDIQAVVNRAARRLGYRVGSRADRHRICQKRAYRATIRAA